MAVSLLLGGCSRKTAGEEQDYRVAAILPENGKIRATDFWEQVWKGIHTEVQNVPIALSEYPSSESATILNRLTLAYAAEPDGILLFTSDDTDAGLLSLIKEVRESGIKVVVLDTDIGEEYYDAFVGIDNTDAGLQMAEYLEAHWQEGEGILLLSPAASGAVETRKAAFLSYLEGSGLMENVTQVSLPEENEARLEKMEQEVTSAQNPRWIVAFDPSCTIQAEETIRRMNLSQDISLIGFCSAKAQESLPEDPVITAYIMQDACRMGEAAIDQMASLLEGNSSSEAVYYRGEIYDSFSDR